MKLGWYLQRLRRMSAAEVSARVQMAARQRYWANPARRPPGLATLLPGARAPQPSASRRADAPQTTPGASRSDRRRRPAAGGRLAGVPPRARRSSPAPDWFRDPLTGRVAPAHDYAFAVPFRDEAQGRQHQIRLGTVPPPGDHLARLRLVADRPRRLRRARRAASALLVGQQPVPHRRALDERHRGRACGCCPGPGSARCSPIGPASPALFDANDAFAGQLYHHQLYISAFHSRGSSANNHLIAELAGVASAAVRAFPGSGNPRAGPAGPAPASSSKPPRRPTPTGSIASRPANITCFVFELLAAAALAARLAGQDLAAGARRHRCSPRPTRLPPASTPPASRPASATATTAAACCSTRRTARRRPPCSTSARALFGAAPWWPAPGGSVLGHVAALLGARDPPRRTSAAVRRFRRLRHDPAARRQGRD